MRMHMHNRPGGFWIARLIVKALVFATIAIAGFGQAVHYLWNLLMPELFGLHAITFWQAVGLLFLSWVLFGGWRGLGHGGRGGPHWRHRRWEMMRWERMTPEEREQMRAGWKHWCRDKRSGEEHSPS